MNNTFTKQTLTGLCVDSLVVTETAVVFSCTSKSRITVYRRVNTLTALSQIIDYSLPPKNSLTQQVLGTSLKSQYI